METNQLTTIKSIANDAEHYAALEKLMALHEAPEVNVQAVKELGDAIHAYECRNGDTVGEPETLRGILEVEMFKHRMSQRAMSKYLEVTETRFSEILNGKRDMNMDFARKLYNKLKIPADTILSLTA